MSYQLTHQRKLTLENQENIQGYNGKCLMGYFILQKPLYEIVIVVSFFPYEPFSKTICDSIKGLTTTFQFYKNNHKTVKLDTTKLQTQPIFKIENCFLHYTSTAKMYKTPTVIIICIIKRSYSTGKSNVKQCYINFNPSRVSCKLSKPLHC